MRFNGLQNVLQILAGSFGNFIRASNEGELATAKLTQSLQNQGICTTELLNDLKAFASARQEAAAIADDATVAVLGQLTALAANFLGKTR
jgi:hypothetical protein